MFPVTNPLSIKVSIMLIWPLKSKMITQIISVLKLQKLTRVGPIFKNTSEWEKFQSSFGTLKAQYDFFFHITIEASDFFFSPYSSRYVFLYGTHGESCQYGLCSLPICNPPQPQISHPTLLPYQGPWKYRWNILVSLILKLVSTLTYILQVLNPNAPDFFS